jgi:hypothetical protein
MGLVRVITPRNRLLAILVWLTIVAAFSAALWFFVFPYVDRLIPGAGMF